MSTIERLKKAAEYISLQSPIKPKALVVLGSGLGSFAETLTDSVAVAFSAVPGMPVSTVSGHSSRLLLGTSSGVGVLVLQGRVHRYEGRPAQDVVFGVRLGIHMGANVVVLTNAAGGMGSNYSQGDLMVISDHINLTGDNCLIGPNEEALGPRFPDMSNVYDARLSKYMHEAAKEHGFALQEGVYAGVLGPSYETPAEIRMLANMGAQAVGMSTVLEAIAARHMGARVAGLSCITDLAAGMAHNPILHEDVLRVAKQSEGRVEKVISGLIKRLGAENPSAI